MMTAAELRSLERLCSKDDLSDSNVATLTVLGLAAAHEIRARRSLDPSVRFVCQLAKEVISVRPEWTDPQTDEQRVQNAARQLLVRAIVALDSALKERDE